LYERGLRHPGDWCKQEFHSVKLGDKRLDERFIMTAERLLASPESSINQACIGWSETKAAYRLFDNERVTEKKILSGHQSRFRERMAGHPVILGIQDKTYFDFDPKPERNSSEAKRRFDDVHGIVMHHMIGVTPVGIPLGVIYQEMHDRNVGSIRDGHYEHQSIPFESKESFHWVLALREAKKFEGKKTRVITIGDRESDIFEFMHEARKIEASYVIRAAKDRAIWNGKNRNETGEKLWSKINKTSVKGKLQIYISPQKDRKERTATVSIRYSQVTLRPPYRQVSARSGKLEPIKVTAILVREIRCPKNETPLEWMLLTDLSVDTFEQAKEKIGWYAKRWCIECYHKVMKSGFRIEACRMRETQRLSRLICLISVLAVRISAMTQLARHQGAQSCETVLTTEEWKALFCKIKRVREPPKAPPDLSTALQWIAILGGYLARKNDPPPGTMVVWRGWRRLTEVTDDWLLFSKTCG
jgi:Transposase DNA-binding/Transposase DDE domain